MRSTAWRLVPTAALSQVGVRTPPSVSGMQTQGAISARSPDTRLGSTAWCFSPDSMTLASGSEDATVRLWDVSTGSERHTLTGHTKQVNRVRNGVTSVAFSPDGTTIASGAADRTIRLWDANTGSERHTLTEHRSGVNSVAFSPGRQHPRKWGVGTKPPGSGTQTQGAYATHSPHIGLRSSA